MSNVPQIWVQFNYFMLINFFILIAHFIRDIRSDRAFSVALWRIQRIEDELMEIIVRLILNITVLREELNLTIYSRAIKIDLKLVF